MARKYDNQGRALATFTTDSRSTINKRKKGIKVADKAAKTKATPRKQGLLTDLQEKRNMTYQSVKGTMKGEQVNTTGSMFKAKVNSEVNSGPAKMNTSVYKPTNMTGSPYGEAKLAGKGRRGTPKGNSVPGTAAVKKKAPVNKALVSKNTPSGVNRMDKTKKKSNKRIHQATMMAKKLMGGGTKRY